jgi:hypothetical protein
MMSGMASIGATVWADAAIASDHSDIPLFEALPQASLGNFTRSFAD